MKFLYLGMSLLTLFVLTRANETQHLPSPPTTHIAPVADAALEEKWQWALNQAKDLHQPRFLAVYTFHTQFQEDRILWSSGNMRFSHFGSNGGNRTLRSVLAAAGEQAYAAKLPDQNHHLALVWEFRSSPNGSPELLSVHASDMILPVSLDAYPVYWLGETNSSSSLAHVMAAYDQTSDFRAKRRLVAMAGLHKEPGAVPFLERVLTSESNHDLRAEAVEALAWQMEEQALALLLSVARKDSSQEVREHAICALGERGGDQARDLLLDVLKNETHRRLRAEAASALAVWTDKPVVEALTQALWKDSSEDVREQALEALTADDRNPELLERVATTHSDHELRGHAIMRLAEARGAAALPLIESVLRGAPGEVMCEAVQALEELPEEKALPLLQQVIANHRNQEVRVQAIGTLGNFPTPAVLELLTKLVDSADEDIREQALDVLSEWPDDNGRKTLTSLLKKYRA